MEYRNENHNKSIMAAFQERFKTQTDCDVGLICDGRIVKAHRCIITMFSPFLKQLFDCQIPKQQIFSGNICCNIAFINYRYNHLMELLRYMYTGVLKIPQEDAPAFVKCAEDLKIVGVLDYLRAKLKQDGDAKKRKMSDSDRPSESAESKRVKQAREAPAEAKTKKTDSSVAKSGPQGAERAVVNTQEQPKMDTEPPSSVSQPPASSQAPLSSASSSTSVMEDLLKKITSESEEGKSKTEKAPAADVSKQIETSLPKESVKSSASTVIEKVAVNNVQKESKSAINSSNIVEKTPQKVVGNTILQSISRPSTTPSQKSASDAQKSASSSKPEKMVDGDKTPKMRYRSDSDSSSKGSKGDKYRGTDDGHKGSSSKSHSDASKSKNGTPSVSKHSDSSRSGHKSGDRKDKEGESAKKSRQEDKVREKKDEDSRKDREKPREKERDREKEKEKDGKSGRAGGSGGNGSSSGSEKDNENKSAVKRTPATPEVVTLSPIKVTMKCSDCGKSYPEGAVHKKVSSLSSESNKCHFPECNKQMKFRRQVIDHLVKFHKVDLCEDN